MKVFHLIQRLEETVKTLVQQPTPKFATIKAVDCFGTAPWNRKKFIPAVLVDVRTETGEWIDYNTPCRVCCFGARDNAGVWLPPSIGAKVPLYFFGTILSPFVDLNGFYNETFAPPPDEATETNMVIKHGGHTIILDSEDGENNIAITHASGTRTEFDSEGNLNVVIKKDLSATVDGNVAVDVVGSVNINANEVSIRGTLIVELSSDNRISLKTAGLLKGILTEATHPVCFLTGAPITGHPDIQAG